MNSQDRAQIYELKIELIYLRYMSITAIFILFTIQYANNSWIFLSCYKDLLVIISNCSLVILQWFVLSMQRLMQKIPNPPTRLDSDTPASSYLSQWLEHGIMRPIRFILREDEILHPSLTLLTWKEMQSNTCQLVQTPLNFLELIVILYLQNCTSVQNKNVFFVLPEIHYTISISDKHMFILDLFSCVDVLLRCFVLCGCFFGLVFSFVDVSFECLLLCECSYVKNIYICNTIQQHFPSSYN